MRGPKILQQSQANQPNQGHQSWQSNSLSRSPSMVALPSSIRDSFLVLNSSSQPHHVWRIARQQKGTMIKYLSSTEA